MRTPKDLRESQRIGVRYAIQTPKAMINAPVGSGKTAIGLTTFMEHKVKDRVKKCVIVGPLSVVSTAWESDAKDWTHTCGLTFSNLCVNDEKKRIRAFFKTADMYLLNLEKMNWFADMVVKHYLKKGEPSPFEMVIYDEISFLKDSSTLRMAGGKRDREIVTAIAGKVETVEVKFTGWKEIIPSFQYTLGLTATPTPRGYIDLHGQYFALDKGATLGVFKSNFESAYFSLNSYTNERILTASGKTAIEDRISHNTIRLSTKGEYEMPDLLESDHVVQMDSGIKKSYNQLVKDLILDVDNTVIYQTASRKGLMTKLEQVANGGIYLKTVELPEDDEEFGVIGREFHPVHTLKIKALEDIVSRLNGGSIVVIYKFHFEAEEIMKRFKGMKPVHWTSKIQNRMQRVIDDFKQGKCRMIIGHVKSMGFGLNGLQHAASTIVFMGRPYNHSDYYQAVGRLHRSGQDNVVSAITIMTKGTIDEKIKLINDRKLEESQALEVALDFITEMKQEIIGDVQPSKELSPAVVLPDFLL